MAETTTRGSDRTGRLAGVAAFRFCLRRLLIERWSDPILIGISFLQPVIVGFALSLSTNDIQTRYFLAYTAVGWFGLRNGQTNVNHEIRQLASRGVSVTGKIGSIIAHIFFSAFVTTVQTIVLFAVLAIAHLGLPGRWPVLVAVVLLGWISAVGWLLLSLFFDSPNLLNTFAPIVVVLQMLSSGFVIVSQDMPPWQLSFCNWTPGFATERIIELSLLTGNKISGDLVMQYPRAYFNIGEWHRNLTGERLYTSTVYYFTDLFVYPFSVLTGWLCALFFCAVAAGTLHPRNADPCEASRSNNRGKTNAATRGNN
jgi:ABC-2 type transporter